MSNELQPKYELTFILDGDDDAQIQTANAHRILLSRLESMKDDSWIRGYVLKEHHGS